MHEIFKILTSHYKLNSLIKYIETEGKYNILVKQRPSSSSAFLQYDSRKQYYSSESRTTTLKPFNFTTPSPGDTIIESRLQNLFPSRQIPISPNKDQADHMDLISKVCKTGYTFCSVCKTHKDLEIVVELWVSRRMLNDR